MNFQELQNEVMNFGFLDAPQVNVGRVQRWINEAQARIAIKVEAPEFQATDTITTATGQQSYALPTDFLRDVSIAFPLLMCRLRPVDIDQLDAMGTDPTIQYQGAPSEYTLWSEQLWLFPTPDTTYTLNMRYIALPPLLVNPTDTPVLNSSYHDLLVTYAVTKGFEAEDDYEASQYFEGKYERDIGKYASDRNNQMKDRPRQVDGSWAGATTGSRIF